MAVSISAVPSLSDRVSQKPLSSAAFLGDRRMTLLAAHSPKPTCKALNGKVITLAS